MTCRRVLRLVSAVCVALGLASAGCHSKETPAFPVAQGSTWSYAGDSDNQPISQEARITSSREQKGSREVVIEWSAKGRSVQDEQYIVSRDQVTRSRGGDSGTTLYQPPIPVLKLPIAVGQRWTWDGKVLEPRKTWMAATAIGRVAAREKLKTQAGEFDTYRVLLSLTMTYPDRKSQQTNATTLWFAPGVGIVKQMSDQTTPDGVRRESTRELTKYHIAQ